MATISAAPIVIDGKGHLLGRLASIVAKQLLTGQVNSHSLIPTEFNQKLIDSSST